MGIILAIILMFTPCCSLSHRTVKSLLTTIAGMGIAGLVVVPWNTCRVGRGRLRFDDFFFSRFWDLTVNSPFWWCALAIYIFCCVASASVYRTILVAPAAPRSGGPQIVYHN